MSLITFSTFRIKVIPIILSCIIGLFCINIAIAANGTVVGTELKGFGRMVFSFDKEVTPHVKLSHTILIIEFDEPVKINTEKLNEQLPTYISISRVDPDGLSIRFALNDRFKVDLKPAGERVFLDILNPNWKGSPPSLPPEVVQELLRRVHAAEEQLRHLVRDKQNSSRRDIIISSSNTPRFSRLIFEMPRLANASHSITDGKVEIVFEGDFQLASELVRTKLAGIANSVEVYEEAARLRLSFVLLQNFSINGFQEDHNYIIDFIKEDIPASISPNSSKDNQLDNKNKLESESQSKPRGELENSSNKSTEAAKQDAHKSANVASSEDKFGNVLLQAAASELNSGKINSPLIAKIEEDKESKITYLKFIDLNRYPFAIFQRGTTLFVLVEAEDGIDVAPSFLEGGHFDVTNLPKAVVFSYKSSKEGEFWLERKDNDFIVKHGMRNDDIKWVGEPVSVNRDFDDQGREVVSLRAQREGLVHILDDPVSGGKISVVPIIKGGFVTEKTMAFPEFTIEPTMAGIVVLPLDENIIVRRSNDKVVISHEIKLNLSLSSFVENNDQEKFSHPLMLSVDDWNEYKKTSSFEYEAKLIRDAAESPVSTNSEARARLARFYIANERYQEAKGVLDYLTKQDSKSGESKPILFLRIIAATMSNRLDEAVNLLSSPAITKEGEQKLWRAVVDAKAMRYQQAYVGFKSSEDILNRYPLALQRVFRPLDFKSALEVKDSVAANKQLKGYERLIDEFRNLPLQQLLSAKLAELDGRLLDAHYAYDRAAETSDRETEAEARLGLVRIAISEGKTPIENLQKELETLSVIWRKSEVEIQSLSILGDIYAKKGRWRDAFMVAQRATLIMPSHPLTKKLEDAMARHFEDMFLDERSDTLSKVETLAIYQEFRSLVPIGKKGDDIASRLVDRLYDLDLVEEAGKILEHQIKYRLQGVAQSQVAAKLAFLYLENHNPIKAIEIIRKTRLAYMPEELRRARLMLESRALGELFRYDIAIDLLSNEKGDDIEHLRADIYWNGKQWREAGETYERIVGDVWKKDGSISEDERKNILRAALSYVLSDEKLSTSRLHERYYNKFLNTKDALDFSILTYEKPVTQENFRNVVRGVVNADILTAFMETYRKKYPEIGIGARPVKSAGEDTRNRELASQASNYGQ